MDTVEILGREFLSFNRETQLTKTVQKFTVRPWGGGARTIAPPPSPLPLNTPLPDSDDFLANVGAQTNLTDFPYRDL